MNEHKSKHWTIFLPGHTYCYILGLYFRYTNGSMSIIWIINSVHSKESQQNCLVQVIQRHKYYRWWLETSAEKLMIKLISLPKEIVHFIPHPPNHISIIYPLDFLFTFYSDWFIVCVTYYWWIVWERWLVRNLRLGFFFLIFISLQYWFLFRSSQL